MHPATSIEEKIPYQPQIIIGIVYAMFFLPYSGTSIPAYIIALLFLLVNVMHLKFKMIDSVLLLIVIGWFVLKCQQSSLSAAVTLLRYYFGFYIFYLFFNNLKFKINLEKLLFWISVMVIIEAVLINTVISPKLLPNYPKNEVEDAFKTQILGFYQRPYSIGTNSSITSTILVLLLFSIEKYKQKAKSKISRILMATSTFAIAILGSGVGYMLYLLFLIYKINPFKNILRTIISIFVILGIYILLFVVNIGSVDGLEKISNVYMGFLYDFKASQIQDALYAFKGETGFWLIGQKFDDPKDLIIWSDFAWENLFYCTGLVGLILTLIIFIVKANKHNFIPLVIFMLGAIHYGAMYSLPGQLLLGYLFAKSYTTFVDEYTVRHATDDRQAEFAGSEAV